MPHVSTNLDHLAAVRAKLAAIPTADRCSPDCPGWAIFNADTAPEIQRCDACCHHSDVQPFGITDEDVALLPEAQAELRRAIKLGDAILRDLAAHFPTLLDDPTNANVSTIAIGDVVRATLARTR